MNLTHVSFHFLNAGTPKEDWAKAAQYLEVLTENPNNVVRVGKDSEKEEEISLIYIQLEEQRNLFKKYGELVQLDATYKINQAGMPLFTLLVVDNYGFGQPVAFFFVKEEKATHVLHGLSIFAEVKI